jgi:hypothetical protein
MSAADDEATLRTYALTLAAAIERALPQWLERCVARFVVLDASVAAVLARAVDEAAAEVMPEIRAVLLADVDQQRINPLALLRAAVRFPTAVLAGLEVPPVARDEFARRNFPDDLYDLTPASFADVDPALHEPGLVWGAAKAHVVLQRRRAEGRR